MVNIFKKTLSFYGKMTKYQLLELYNFQKELIENTTDKGALSSHVMVINICRYLLRENFNIIFPKYRYNGEQFAPIGIIWKSKPGCDIIGEQCWEEKDIDIAKTSGPHWATKIEYEKYT